jgi:signal transduction histidine kinase
MLNGVSDPILLTDPAGRLLLTNPRAEKLFRAQPGDSDGRRRALAVNHLLFAAALMGRAAAGTRAAAPSASRAELSLVDPDDGSDLLFEHLCSPLPDPEHGRVLVSVLRNVTDLGRADAELAESYRRLRSADAEVRAERHRLSLIIDTVADPILVTDAAGDIVLMNAPAEALFTDPDGASPEVQRRVRANDAHFSSFLSGQAVSGHGGRWTAEISLTGPSTGRTLPVEAVAGQVLSLQGELTWIVTILHDRTEARERAQLLEQVTLARAELEAKVAAATASLAEQNELLRRQAMELEQVSAAKTQFLANISHELRTPLNAVLGYTSMILQGVQGELNAAQARSLVRVDSNARHLLALINNVLDISRIESGRMPVTPVPFRIPDLLGEVVDELEPIINRSRLRVSITLAEGVRPLRTDRQKVKQIVLNLLSNALKFTPAGSIHISVRLDVRTDEVAIAVKDSGPGISAEDRERIFQDFTQLDNSPSRAHGGTGLGLSICRRLATILGGRITLSSEPGHGSTFTAVLPRRWKGRR